MTQSPAETARIRALFDAERRALALLDAIERERFITPGRSERAVERDIGRLAQEAFGVARHWHKRIVRTGVNTLSTAGDNPLDLVIGEDDLVFLDLGPVFGEWEADVGRTYAVGSDPRKHALCADLPIIFDALKARYDGDPGITGAALYAFACEAAAAHGWRFGGVIAGHVVGEFPHAHLPGTRDHQRISATNHTRMCDPDAFGRARYWIGEVHLLAPDRSFGGFYERLLHDAPHP